MLPYGVAQRCLSRKDDRLHVVFHLEYRMLGIPDHPESQSIHRHGIAGECLLCTKVGCPYSCIHELCDSVDQWKQNVQSWSIYAAVFTHSEYDHLVPMQYQLNRSRDE